MHKKCYLNMILVSIHRNILDFLQLTLIISNTGNSNYCLRETPFWIMLHYFALFSLHFNAWYLKLLSSQTDNTGPLESEIIVFHFNGTHISGKASSAIAFLMF